MGPPRIPVDTRYRFAWNNLTAAATLHGFQVTQLARPGTQRGKQQFDDLAELMDWSPATRALYAKIVRFADVPVDLRTTPEPATDLPPIGHLLIVHPGPPDYFAYHMRAVLLCHLAARTDLALPVLVRLRDADIDVHSSAATVTIRPPSENNDTPLTVTSASLREVAYTWITEVRPDYDTLDGPYLFPAFKPSPHGNTVGLAMSARTAQVAFRAHTVAVGNALADIGDPLADHYRTLTLQTFRRVARQQERRSVRSQRVSWGSIL